MEEISDSQNGPTQFAPGPYPHTYMQVKPPKNDLAVLSLVFGCLGIAAGFGALAGIPAVILGKKAKEAQAQGLANNGEMATAGIVLGWVGIGMGVLIFLVIVAQFGFIAHMLFSTDMMMDSSFPEATP